MHELSIAQAILRIALAYTDDDDTRIAGVYVSVGHLRQLVPDALEFAFELSAQGTPAEGAALVLEQVPAAVRCRACGAESEPGGFPLACTACGGLDVNVVRGEELTVDALELEHEELEEAAPAWPAAADRIAAPLPERRHATTTRSG